MKSLNRTTNNKLKKLSNDSNAIKYQLLEDNPLSYKEENKELKFGHELIVATLIDLIKSIKTPFCIGLYGKWGTGKTTIIYHLKGELKKIDIDVVYFDAWKYEDDSLRREFLLETSKALSA